MDCTTDLRATIRERVGADAYARHFERAIEMDGANLTVRVESDFMASWVQREFGAALRSVIADKDRGAGRLRVEVAPATARKASQSPGRDAQQRPGNDRRNPPAASRPRQAPQTLDGFIVGACNTHAYQAAVGLLGTGDDLGCRVVLFHGHCGTGKTMLLRGIAGEFTKRHLGARVRCGSAEGFVSEFVRAVRENAVPAFQRRFRDVDLLCLDDVQFLSRKPGSQIELLNTFDALRGSGARVVLVSDNHPTNIKELGAALRSRLASGLICRLDPPDYETASKILRELAKRRGVLITDDAVGLLVSSVTSKRGSVRDLEGLYLRSELLAGARQTGDRTVNADAARSAFGAERNAERPLPAGRHRIKADHVVDAVCREFGIDKGALADRGRHKRVVLARGVIAYLCRELTGQSFPEIALAMGKQSHSTFVTACSRIEQKMRSPDPIDAGPTCPGQAELPARWVDTRTMVYDLACLIRGGPGKH